VPVLAEVVPPLLQRHTAEDILNEILVPAMKEVGRLFNDGVLTPAGINALFTTRANEVYSATLAESAEKG
jgi:3-hydroxyacyl-CoA dehydrogenase